MSCLNFAGLLSFAEFTSFISIMMASTRSGDLLRGLIYTAGFLLLLVHCTTHGSVHIRHDSAYPRPKRIARSRREILGPAGGGGAGTSPAAPPLPLSPPAVTPGEACTRAFAPWWALAPTKSASSPVAAAGIM